MTGDCQHEQFAACVEVQRLARADGKIGNYLADITVSCAACGVPFHFIGPECGLSFLNPTTSVGATTLHAPIAPGVADLPERIRFEVVSDH